MKVESIAECSPWSILQYVWPALSDNWFWKPICGLLRVAVLHRFYCSFMSAQSLEPENSQYLVHIVYCNHLGGYGNQTRNLDLTIIWTS